jgi:hypothetical protein
MNVFAYCAASFEETTRRAAGVEPVTCPPVSAEHFEKSWLEGRGFCYFDLHGVPGGICWYGDEGIVALTATQILRCDLTGVIVFATNCYLADEESPMMDVLLEAGARYVIGGPGRNWAGSHLMYGAGLLGWRFRQLLDLQYHPLRAIAVAKRWVRLALVANRLLGKKEQVQAEEDTLAFRIYYRRDTDEIEKQTV